MYIPSENDLRLLRQRGKVWRARIEVLNARYQILAEVQGQAIDMSLNIDASSDARRTCSLTMHVLNSSFEIDNDSYFWLDKFIRLYYGIYDAAHSEYVYYPLGIFLLNDNSYSYDANQKQLTLSLIDLMALGTDTRGSAIGVSETVIEVGNSIRNAMISVVTQHMGCQRYKVKDFPSGQVEVPYDLEFNAGVYPYEIITKLRDLYPCNQTYFDVDGTFICEDIPSLVDDPLTLDASIIDPLVISESRSVSFSSVRNVTEIWGMELKADRTTDSCKSKDGVYVMTIPDIEVMDDGVTYCLTPDVDNIAGAKAQINELTACPIMVHKDKSDGTAVDEAIDAGVMRKGLPYVLRYTDGKFYYWGELNVHGIAMAVNAEPTDEQKQQYEKKYDCRNIRYVVNPLDRFAVERIGEIRQVLTGDDYDAIYTSELAAERAAYENWRTTRLQDEITLDMILIPWLDVNKLIEYTSPMTGEKMKAIVSSISMSPAEGTMSMGLTRFYPYYPW